MYEQCIKRSMFHVWIIHETMPDSYMNHVLFHVLFIHGSCIVLHMTHAWTCMKWFTFHAWNETLLYIHVSFTPSCMYIHVSHTLIHARVMDKTMIPCMNFEYEMYESCMKRCMIHIWIMHDHETRNFYACTCSCSLRFMYDWNWFLHECNN